MGPHVYNPSTYSYLLTPTTGSSAADGAVLSQFVNYALTLGQHEAPSIGFASLGLSLEQYGVNRSPTERSRGRGSHDSRKGGVRLWRLDPDRGPGGADDDHVRGDEPQ